MSQHTIYCQITGVPLATLSLRNTVLASCASLPWQGDWKALVLEHPMFALTPNQCLRVARINFRALAALTPDDQLLPENAPILELATVSFVAVLKLLGVVTRRAGSNNLPYIQPAAATVLVHGQNLLELAYWFTNLTTKRFSFPYLNIARINSNTELGDIGAYLSICRENRAAYEETRARKVLQDITDTEFVDAAARTEALVRNAGTRRLPKTSLWNWFIHAIKADDAVSYERLLADPNELPYLKALFFASDAALKRYSLDDVDALEDLMLRYAPLGTTPFSAMRNDLTRIKNIIQKLTKSFTVDWMSLTVGNSGIKPVVNVVAPDGTARVLDETTAMQELAASAPPTAAEYPDKIALMRATAKWNLAKFKVEAASAQAARNTIF